MTSTSQYKGIIRWRESDYAAGDPLSAGHVRTLINNGNHLADQAGQVRVAWAERTGDIPKSPLDAAIDDEWTLIHRFGPWHATIDEKGNPFPLRVRLAMRSVSGASATIGVSYAASGRSHDVVADPSGDDWLQFSTTSTTSVWVGATSRDLVDLVRLHRDNVTVQSVSARGAGAVREGVDVVPVEIALWHRNTTGDARATAFYAAEYYSP